MTTVAIREVVSREEVQRAERHEDEWDAVEYWRDGNGACDCNRELGFLRGKGLLGEDEMPDDASGFCLGVERYAVRVIGANGATLYEDNGVPAQ